MPSDEEDDNGPSNYFAGGGRQSGWEEGDGDENGGENYYEQGDTVYENEQTYCQVCG